MPQLQRLQFLNLLLVMTLGYFSGHLYLDSKSIVILLLFTAMVEHLLLYYRERVVGYFSVSALTTALGVMLMMVSPYLWIYMSAIAAGLTQKHLLRYEGRHLFNPSNFALIFAMSLFYDQAHIVLGQLGDAYWFAALIILIGIMILIWAKRWLIPLGFVAVYLGSQYIMIVQSDPVMLFEDVLFRFYSVSFIVFILFMLTDPQTTPEQWYAQALFGGSVALLAAALDYYYGFRVQHLFIALFLVSALRIFSYKGRNHPKDLIIKTAIIILVLSVIITIQIQAPYHFEMD